MGSPGGPPVAEEFGLTEEVVAFTPDAFLVRHRCSTLIVVISLAVVVVAVLMISARASVIASIFFAPILVAASLILVLPLAFAAVCFAGSIETRWRSRNNPSFAACARYRQAVDQFRQDLCRNAEIGRQSSVFWTMCSQSELLHEVRVEVGRASVELVDREVAGVDLVVNRGEQTWIIRCESGRQPVKMAVGRELAGVSADSIDCRVVLVAPAGLTPELSLYLEGHSVSVFDGVALSKGRLGALINS